MPSVQTRDCNSHTVGSAAGSRTGFGALAVRRRGTEPLKLRKSMTWRYGGGSARAQVMLCLSESDTSGRAVIGRMVEQAMCSSSSLPSRDPRFHLHRLRHQRRLPLGSLTQLDDGMG